eukprot:Gb_01122 [translate_table: standard]
MIGSSEKATADGRGQDRPDCKVLCKTQDLASTNYVETMLLSDDDKDDKNIQDTSVLVRLRLAWDYALEMWMLLDIEACLINYGDLLDRVLCVKSGFRKFLLNVFHDGIYHPKLAIVFDDGMKVWEDKDQLRVHAVLALALYYAPQVEMSNLVPVLCVTRNVACNMMIKLQIETYHRYRFLD